MLSSVITECVDGSLTSFSAMKSITHLSGGTAGDEHLSIYIWRLYDGIGDYF